MSDDDLIRRGDVLREIANEGLHILDAAIAALPARGVGVKPSAFLQAAHALDKARATLIKHGYPEKSVLVSYIDEALAAAKPCAEHPNCPTNQTCDHCAGRPTDAAQAREAALRKAAGVILNDFDALLKVAGKAVEAHNSGLSLTEGVRRGLRALINEDRT